MNATITIRMENEAFAKDLGVTTVARDPFARTELIRRSQGQGECTWCGSRRRVFTYEVESDGGRRFGESKSFCNLGCYHSFHD